MELTFNDFKKRAQDTTLSKWEKIGFPDSYRKGIESQIANDIFEKTQWKSSCNVLDIGCGCSDLVNHFINHTLNTQSHLYLNDSSEMLQNISTSNEAVEKHEGCFPNVSSLMEKKAYFDIIIVYSVIQYVYLEQSMFNFLHECLKLLKPNGRLLIGDIPNISARNRFLKSEAGEQFLKNEITINPNVDFSHEDCERIDDSIVLSILSRFRNYGCETYLLPQSPELPFSNRREDILIIKR